MIMTICSISLRVGRKLFLHPLTAKQRFRGQPVLSNSPVTVFVTKLLLKGRTDLYVFFSETWSYAIFHTTLWKITSAASASHKYKILSNHRQATHDRQMQFPGHYRCSVWTRPDRVNGPNDCSRQLHSFLLLFPRCRTTGEFGNTAHCDKA